MFEQGVENVLIVHFGKKIGDGFRHHLAETFDIVDFRAGLGPFGCNTRGFTQRLEGTEIAGETPGVGFADMPDAERENKAIERERAARLDRVKKISYRKFAKTFAVLQIYASRVVSRSRA